MSRTLKHAGVQIALVAMLLRALLPAGWMPADNSGAPFTICTVNGPVHLAQAPDGRTGKGSQDDGRQNDICPFAASVHLATPTTLVVVAPSTKLASFTFVQSPMRAVQVAARYALQSPRAPPSLV